jgi:hypothetical protein
MKTPREACNWIGRLLGTLLASSHPNVACMLYVVEQLGTIRVRESHIMSSKRSTAHNHQVTPPSTLYLIQPFALPCAPNGCEKRSRPLTLTVDLVYPDGTEKEHSREKRHPRGVLLGPHTHIHQFQDDSRQRRATTRN